VISLVGLNDIAAHGLRGAARKQSKCALDDLLRNVKSTPLEGALEAEKLDGDPRDPKRLRQDDHAQQVKRLILSRKGIVPTPVIDKRPN
jgi:Txe/YoeB family toxin of Txe-Axe toxin-antitoxin module